MPRFLGRWETHSPEWHEARRNRIGGSEIGPLMGWSPFQTKADLMAQKISGEIREPSKAMLRGQYLEPAIAAWLAGEHGVTYEPEWQGTWVHNDRDWQAYNPDAVTTGGVLCEFKSTSVRDADHGWGRAGGSKVPLGYAAQVQWGLGILGLTEALLAVLSGAPRFEFALYKLNFNPDTFDYLTAQAARFRAELTQERNAA